MNKFLLEIGVEEIPSDMILPAVNQLSLLIKNTCEKYRLNFNLIKTFSTPRRLSVLVEGLPSKQEDLILEKKGPPASIAIDKNKKWTRSALGFAKKNGIKIDDLKIKKFDGIEYLFFIQKKIGNPVPELLNLHITEWIVQINFSKNMRWGTYQIKFVRPIRWVVSLWNKSILPIKLEMLESGRMTRGHRFLNPGENLIRDAADYKKQLQKLNVMVDFEERRDSIISQIKELEIKHNFEVELDSDLLIEVTNLVEWPTVILGEFEKEFLKLPDEVLITTMAVNQRYFPVFKIIKKQKTGQRKLLPFFVTVRNGSKKNIDIVRRGNSKVLYARLSDARFFYKEDQKKSIDFFCQRSENVVFFPGRGSQSQRVDRITSLSRFICEKMGLSVKQKKYVERISTLSKYDLETQMVQEFPKLQGIMGANYASLKNESRIVCRGIREQYLPRNTKDSIPKDLETAIVGISDRVDLLIIAFSLNLIPSGAADPFALRRTAQGLIDMILELRLFLNIQEIILKGITIIKDQLSFDFDNIKLNKELISFLSKRHRWSLQEKGFRYDLIDAVLGDKSKNISLNNGCFNQYYPSEQLKLIELLSEYLDTEIFKRSVESIVRAENICKKFPNKIPQRINERDLQLGEEKRFYKILGPILNSDINVCWSPKEYLKHLLLIEPVVTSFFENILVMDNDPVKCGNRLWLCKELSNWSKRHLDLKKIVFH